MSVFYYDKDSTSSTFNASDYVKPSADTIEVDKLIYVDNGYIREELAFSKQIQFDDNVLCNSNVQITNAELNVVDANSNIKLKIQPDGQLTCGKINDIDLSDEQLKLTTLKTRVDTLTTTSIADLDTIQEIGTYITDHNVDIGTLLTDMPFKASKVRVDNMDVSFNTFKNSTQTQLINLDTSMNNIDTLTQGQLSVLDLSLNELKVATSLDILNLDTSMNNYKTSTSLDILNLDTSLNNYKTLTDSHLTSIDTSLNTIVIDTSTKLLITTYNTDVNARQIVTDKNTLDISGMLVSKLDVSTYTPAYTTLTNNILANQTLITDLSSNTYNNMLTKQSILSHTSDMNTTNLLINDVSNNVASYNTSYVSQFETINNKNTSQDTLNLQQDADILLRETIVNSDSKLLLKAPKYNPYFTGKTTFDTVQSSEVPFTIANYSTGTYNMDDSLEHSLIQSLVRIKQVDIQPDVSLNQIITMNLQAPTTVNMGLGSSILETVTLKIDGASDKGITNYAIKAGGLSKFTSVETDKVNDTTALQLSYLDTTSSIQDQFTTSSNMDISQNDRLDIIDTKTIQVDTSLNNIITNYALNTYVDSKVASLVDSSPAVLNTLNELAIALGNDPNFATSVASSIGLKVDISDYTILNDAQDAEISAIKTVNVQQTSLINTNNINRIVDLNEAVSEIDICLNAINSQALIHTASINTLNTDMGIAETDIADAKTDIVTLQDKLTNITRSATQTTIPTLNVSKINYSGTVTTDNTINSDTHAQFIIPNFDKPTININHDQANYIYASVLRPENLNISDNINIAHYNTCVMQQPFNRDISANSSITNASTLYVTNPTVGEDSNNAIRAIGNSYIDDLRVDKLYTNPYVTLDIAMPESDDNIGNSWKEIGYFMLKDSIVPTDVKMNMNLTMIRDLNFTRGTVTGYRCIVWNEAVTVQHANVYIAETIILEADQVSIYRANVFGDVDMPSLPSSVTGTKYKVQVVVYITEIDGTVLYPFPTMLWNDTLNPTTIVTNDTNQVNKPSFTTTNDEWLVNNKQRSNELYVRDTLVVDDIDVGATMSQWSIVNATRTASDTATSDAIIALQDKTQEQTYETTGNTKTKFSGNVKVTGNLEVIGTLSIPEITTLQNYDISNSLITSDFETRITAVESGGTQGDQGIKGDQGIQGIQGIQGNAGTNGSDGSDSTVQGPQGIQGIQGIQGTQGTSASTAITDDHETRITANLTSLSGKQVNQAGNKTTLGSNAINNNGHGTVIGYNTKCSGSSVVIGSGSCKSYGAQNQSVIIGADACYYGNLMNQCVVVGANGGASLGGTNCTALGYGAGAGGSPHTLGASSVNKIVLGNNLITNAYIGVAWSVTSDIRDKVDVSNCDCLGLDFINNIDVIKYKKNDRSRYIDTYNNKELETIETTTHINDGSKKDIEYTLGISAQQIQTLENQMNSSCSSNMIVSDEDPEKLSLKYQNLIMPLINAVKELTARIAVLENA